MSVADRFFAACVLGSVIALMAGCGGSPSPSSGEKKADATAPPAASIPGTAVPKPNVDLSHPVVVFETTVGSITVKLNAEKAKLTVDNFLKYVDSGHYNQTIFHQVFRGQGVVGGGFGVDLAERTPGLPIRNEADNGLKNRRGTIAMARSADAIDSARNQFFFNVADNEMLDYRDRTPAGYGYCVFGEVVSGEDVLDKIAQTPVQDTPQFDCTPVQPVIVKNVRRSR
jgi:cyclophilin family peptidyl-prolyl cis-trans isomerase